MNQTAAVVCRGTGASCIYPLLGTKVGGWSFVATDIDETSLRHARHNVVLNHLEDMIELRHLHPDDLLLGTLLSEAVETASHSSDQG
jgi:23S rRNA (adenine1618-N6)-methyltransferase